MRYLIRIAAWADHVSEFTGRVAGWLVVVMVGLTVYDVVMRYVFRRGSVALQELEWHLFAAVFLLGAAYTLRHRHHVRVDLLYASRFMSDRQRALVDLAGNLLFLVPFCALIIWSSVPFVYDAWMHGEVSPDPGGLTARWIPKALIPLSFVLLMLQGLADTVTDLTRLLSER